ncbi:MAG: sigma-70 family RNA polymerase sigma factor [Gammaproteobacteria bacterium]
MSDDGDFKLGDLVRRHHRGLVRFVSGIVRSRHAAEDIMHDVYVKFSRGGVDTGAIEQPKIYLFRAARNAALDHAERQRVEWKHRERRDVQDLLDVPSPEPQPDAHVDSRQRIQLMADALNELPAACREAFVLNKLQGLDHRTIAARLGVSVSMVEKHIMRAMSHCRDRLRLAEKE